MYGYIYIYICVFSNPAASKRTAAEAAGDERRVNAESCRFWIGSTWWILVAHPT